MDGRRTRADLRQRERRDGGSDRLSPSVSLGTPVRLFENLFSTWDVSLDGKRFVAVQPPADAAQRTASQIHLVTNWFEELKARVPTK
jgi:hypothetical protein